MQYFKGDDREKQFEGCAAPILDQVSTQLDEFYDGAYEAAPLGDLLWDEDRAPLSNAIKKEIFRDSFKEIFEAFQVAGTFESYLTVFRKIFGEDVDVDFTVPGPGQLNIVIHANGLEISDLLARYIEDNEYIFDEIVDYDGDNIAVQTIKGFQTQYELEQMLFELVPLGVFTDIDLTLGEG